MTNTEKHDTIPHTNNWRQHYPIATHRGGKYPVPEDWTLDIVEFDGVMWDRFEDVGHECKHDHDAVEARGGGMDAGTPDETASLGRESETKIIENGNGNYETEPVADPADHKLEIEGNTVFKIWGAVNENVLWAATAKILAQYSRGEDYTEIVDAIDETIEDTNINEDI